MANRNELADIEYVQEFYTSMVTRLRKLSGVLESADVANILSYVEILRNLGFKFCKYCDINILKENPECEKHKYQQISQGDNL